jgi:S-DNA-T family DNA segregation ATPase FtsK/SpoIIIE
VAGPHITRYELRLAPGVKMNKVAGMKDDLAYALAATDIRILAPIPGKQAVGVEVPNLKRKMVTLGDVYGEAPEGSSPLTVWLGKDVSGKAIAADLAKMPHILVAGHHGRGQVGLHQRDALEHPPARHARGGPPRPRGPQAGRAQPLRGDPAPPHAR